MNLFNKIWAGLNPDDKVENELWERLIFRREQAKVVSRTMVKEKLLEYRSVITFVRDTRTKSVKM